MMAQVTASAVMVPSAAPATPRPSPGMVNVRPFIVVSDCTSVDKWEPKAPA